MTTATRTKSKHLEHQARDVQVSRHLHTRTGYKVCLAVKQSALGDESELVMTTNNPNIHAAIDEAYDEAGLQGFPIIAGVLSITQLPA